MGRRSQHAPEELRELILGAARRIIENSGFASLSAREIAREIGYAPGTLYNMFSNLDEILLRLEARILSEIDTRIAEAIDGHADEEALRRFGATYVDFAYQSPRLWQLVQRHHPRQKGKSPDWYLDCLCAPIGRIEPILARVNGIKDADQAAGDARLLWSAILGIIGIATTEKVSPLPHATTRSMIETITAKLADSNKSPAPRRKTDSGRHEANGKRERSPD